MTQPPHPDTDLFPTPEQLFTTTEQPHPQAEGMPPARLLTFQQSFASGDDLALLSCYSAELDGWLSPVERAELPRARQRLRLTSILRQAVQDDDDDTLCRWNVPALWDAPHTLPISADRLHIALERQQALGEIRESYARGDLAAVLRIWQAADLDHSNLPTALDRAHAQQAAESARPAGMLPASDSLQAWLTSQAGAHGLEDAAVRAAAVQLGFETRVEQALSRLDDAALSRLASPDCAALWRELPSPLRTQAEQRLAAITAS